VTSQALQNTDLLPGEVIPFVTMLTKTPVKEMEITRVCGWYGSVACSHALLSF
jgi:hypothetical protein